MKMSTKPAPRGLSHTIVAGTFRVNWENYHQADDAAVNSGLGGSIARLNFLLRPHQINVLVVGF